MSQETVDAGGIEAVLTRFFADFGERLYNSALLMCRDGSYAEDLVMRTFESAMLKFSQYDRTRPAFSWLCGILTNCYRMDLRGKGRNALDFVPEPPDTADDRPDPAEVLALEADANAVHKAVDNLPERLRALVVLRYFDDLTVPQIAETTGIVEGSVKRMLHEAKNIMRKELLKSARGVFLVLATFALASLSALGEPGNIAENYEPFIRNLRAKRPDVPIVMAEQGERNGAK